LADGIVERSLPTYRKAADLIVASGLDHAILRPAWLTDECEVNFETTERNDPFKGTEVSRKSVAALVAARLVSRSTRQAQCRSEQAQYRWRQTCICLNRWSLRRPACT
jgi:hypothetical protein